ncbi:hypothetical protein G3I76_51600, partial [Streptomyces sp. SID11233]|nr:hypothetical protein [Streptomyces sp. SID11233]
MNIQLLGPLNAVLSDTSIVPEAAKPRQLLALMTVRAGQVLPVPLLMQELWGDHPPRSAVTTLQTYVLQLRRLIGAALGPDSTLAPKEVLLTRHGGYQLQVPQVSVDTYEFERLVAAGRRAEDRADDEAASAAYREALSLWRGPALVDVRTGPVLDVELTR